MLRTKRTGNAQLGQPKSSTERDKPNMGGDGCRLMGVIDDRPMSAVEEEGRVRAKIER